MRFISGKNNLDIYNKLILLSIQKFIDLLNQKYVNQQKIARTQRRIM
jgi:hypothetical protein